ncbi:hypothetical protein ZIOFF_040686 [Zingiber officinale]|uniref:MADS-box domain-containing protein n=1 Tax=Zingiber officinale TaxID=94328 RepID=A0A8J5KY66_ZINOF|nr:hypothetical protein ZIOFF_040686 [Zingiber officinale]
MWLKKCFRKVNILLELRYIYFYLKGVRGRQPGVTGGSGNGEEDGPGEVRDQADREHDQPAGDLPQAPQRLLKKAYELSLLCDAEFALVVFSCRGRLYEYASNRC